MNNKNQNNDNLLKKLQKEMEISPEKKIHVQKMQKRKKGNYILEETIGEGAFAKVKLARHIITGEKVAIKILNKEKMFQKKSSSSNDEFNSNMTKIRKEINILRRLRHKNIIQLYEIIESKSNLYIVMEYCEGKDLFNYIVKRKKLTEREACRYFQQIINGVEYLHLSNITHRDLKPENLLLDNKKRILISDFGLSHISNNTESLLSTPCGTPSYAPPEMLRGKKYNGIFSDIWSCGIILYTMLVGNLPCAESKEELIYQNIMTHNYFYPENLSDDAIDLIEHMLKINPLERYSFDEIKAHPWFNIITPKLRPGIIYGVHKIPIDKKILMKVAKFGYDIKKCEESVIESKYDSLSAIYYLILKQFKKDNIASESDLFSQAYINYLKDYKNWVDPSKINDPIYKDYEVELIPNFEEDDEMLWMPDNNNNDGSQNNLSNIIISDEELKEKKNIFKSNLTADDVFDPNPYDKSEIVKSDKQNEIKNKTINAENKYNNKEKNENIQIKFKNEDFYKNKKLEGQKLIDNILELEAAETKLLSQDSEILSDNKKKYEYKVNKTTANTTKSPKKIIKPKKSSNSSIKNINTSNISNRINNKSTLHSYDNNKYISSPLRNNKSSVNNNISLFNSNYKALKTEVKINNTNNNRYDSNKSADKYKVYNTINNNNPNKKLYNETYELLTEDLLPNKREEIIKKLEEEDLKFNEELSMMDNIKPYNTNINKNLVVYEIADRLINTTIFGKYLAKHKQKQNIKLDLENKFYILQKYKNIIGIIERIRNKIFTKKLTDFNFYTFDEYLNDENDKMFVQSLLKTPGINLFIQKAKSTLYQKETMIKKTYSKNYTIKPRKFQLLRYNTDSYQNSMSNNLFYNKNFFTYHNKKQFDLSPSKTTYRNKSNKYNLYKTSHSKTSQTFYTRPNNYHKKFINVKRSFDENRVFTDENSYKKSYKSPRKKLWRYNSTGKNDSKTWGKEEEYDNKSCIKTKYNEGSYMNDISENEESSSSYSNNGDNKKIKNHKLNLVVKRMNKKIYKIDNNQKETTPIKNTVIRNQKLPCRNNILGIEYYHETTVNNEIPNTTPLLNAIFTTNKDVNTIVNNEINNNNLDDNLNEKNSYKFNGNEKNIDEDIIHNKPNINDNKKNNQNNNFFNNSSQNFYKKNNNNVNYNNDLKELSDYIPIDMNYIICMDVNTIIKIIKNFFKKKGYFLNEKSKTIKANKGDNIFEIQFYKLKDLDSRFVYIVIKTKTRNTKKCKSVITELITTIRGINK